MAIDKDYQRMWDLVRQQRSELFSADLITEDEYAALAHDHPAVLRLESYDSLRAELKKWEEKEGACCPEDVGFPEYIAALEKQLKAAKDALAERLTPEQAAEVIDTGLRAAAQRVTNMEHKLAQSAEDAKGLAEALRALKEDYADSEGCYCGQIVGGTHDGYPMHICGYCLTQKALAAYDAHQGKGSAKGHRG